jgi:hypothetical protein
VKASAEAQLNPSIESASAQPREWVEVLLQLLGVGRVSSWRRAGVTTPALQTGKNPRIAANWPELPSKFIGLGDTAAERRETFGCSAEHPWGLHMTRQARRLRGALRPMTRDARLSALHRGGFRLPGPRFSHRHLRRIGYSELLAARS